jgi:hypothetical protein
MFLRLDNSGLIKCAALLGFSDDDTCYSHVQLENGRKDYVLAGSYFNVASGKNKASFSIVDTICYQSTDGSYALTGRTNYYIGLSQRFEIFVTKLTAAGLPIWTKVYRTPLGTYPPYSNSDSRRIIPMPDGGFVIVGWTNAITTSSARNVLVFRIDANGIIMWGSTYGGYTTIEEGHSIILSSNGNLVLTGYTDSLGTEDVLNIKIPATYSTAPIWAKVFDITTPNDRGYDLEEAFGPAGGYAFTGQTMPSISSSLDPFLMRTDSFGNVTP